MVLLPLFAEREQGLESEIQLSVKFLPPHDVYCWHGHGCCEALGECGYGNGFQ